MSHNGWKNWATHECVNWFGELASEIFAECAENANDEDEAREQFCDSLKNSIEENIDQDLKKYGLDSNLIGLGAEIDDVDYDEIFDAEMKENPNLFDNDDDAPEY